MSEQNKLLKRLAPILQILALPYGMIQKLRLLLYNRGILKTNKLPIKVICVGNITVGGTGKTPTVIQLSKLLQQAGRKVVILSRGYKRTGNEEVLIISEGQGPLVSWQQAGDEPYLLASEIKTPIIVGKKRYLSGTLAMGHFNPGIILLDDGYQHLSLSRDINLLLINASNPFGNGKLLPAGILREPLSAIKRANIVLLSKSDQAENIDHLIQTIKNYNPQAPIFKGIHKPSALIELKTQKDWGLDWLQGKQVVTLSGIGDPASFTRLIEKLGAKVVKEACYPDHYFYKPDDLGQLQGELHQTSAQAIITTTKDALRLPEKTQTNWLPVLVLKIELQIEENVSVWDKFWNEV